MAFSLESGIILFLQNRINAPDTPNVSRSTLECGRRIDNLKWFLDWKFYGQQERRVMAICGGDGFMMNSREMETVVRLKLDLMVLILRDDAYGMIKLKQANMGFDDF
jgi:hypothetical protein